MKDEARWNFFRARTSPHMRAVRVASMWLTKNRSDAQDLAKEALIKTYGLWKPSISKTHCRILLFKMLTWLFFNGFQKRRDNLSLNFNRIVIPCAPRDRLKSVYEYPINENKRMLIRLPIEVGFINFLSKIEGFSPREIGQIIDLDLDLTKSRLHRGFRLLQFEPFTYSGQG